MTTIPNSSGLATLLSARVDRRAPLPVEANEVAEVDVAESVARDDEERLVEGFLGELHRAGRAGRGLLDRVADREAVRLAGAEVAADRLGHEGDA